MAAIAVDLTKFGISRLTGFMPEKQPCKRLPSYYDPWEDLISRLPSLNKEKKIREAVLSLPELFVDEDHLKNEGSWRRAYVVLCFLGQSYIWNEGDRNLPQSVPRCIAVPWCTVSDHLGLPPVMTYASTILYNWYLIDSTRAVLPDNMAISVTCTGTRDEEWFYLVPLFMELVNTAILTAIEAIYGSLHLANRSEVLEEGLEKIGSSIEKLTQVLNTMYDECSPDVFYQSIRPYQAGSMGLDALPNGIVYEGVDSAPRMYSGASAAQNSGIPTLDVVLGVEHKGPETKEFLKLQRQHMPRSHRDFLNHLQTLPTLKKLTDDCGVCRVTEAYDKAVKQLVHFRNQHIILVTRYIVMPKSRLSQKLNQTLENKGTGGSDFMVFLQASRNETLDCKKTTE